MVTENQQWAVIGGANGHVQVRDFVLPIQGHDVSFDVANWAYDFTGCVLAVVDHSRRVSVEEATDSAVDAQETFMFQNFAARVLAGDLDPAWPEIALKTQLVSDACLASARQGGAMVAVEWPP